MRLMAFCLIVGISIGFHGLASDSVVAGNLAGGTGPGASIVGGAPEAIVVVGRSGTVGSWSSGAATRTWTCGYFEPLEGQNALVAFEETPADPRAGRLYLFSCTDQNGQNVQARLVVFDPGDPLAGVAAAERALGEARRRLDLPLPEPVLNPPGAQLVGVATWLWLDGPWQPTEATAAIGAVRSTVTARPVEVTWSMGDGTTVTCSGAGRAYDPARPPRDQSSDCTHVYTRASAAEPGGAHTVTVTVAYEVGWSASTGAGGPLDTLTRTTAVPVVVQQAQAVIR